ncbi:MAG: hypothetical protein ACI4WG_07660 [Erysipelotrichaceae bacterium]
MNSQITKDLLFITDSSQKELLSAFIDDYHIFDLSGNDFQTNLLLVSGVLLDNKIRQTAANAVVMLDGAFCTDLCRLEEIKKLLEKYQLARLVIVLVTKDDNNSITGLNKQLTVWGFKTVSYTNCDSASLALAVHYGKSLANITVILPL